MLRIHNCIRCISTLLSNPLYLDSIWVVVVVVVLVLQVWRSVLFVYGACLQCLSLLTANPATRGLGYQSAGMEETRRLANYLPRYRTYVGRYLGRYLDVLDLASG